MKTSTTIAAALLSGMLFSGATAAQGTPERKTESYALQMHIEGHNFVVRGGAAADPVGILIGLEQADLRLPGGAHLSVAPLLVLAMGEFGADGEYRFDFGEMVGPLDQPVYAQAITMVRESETLATSNALRITDLAEGKLQGRQQRNRDADHEDADREDPKRTDDGVDSEGYTGVGDDGVSSKAARNQSGDDADKQTDDGVDSEGYTRTGDDGVSSKAARNQTDDDADRKADTKEHADDGTDWQAGDER